MVRTERIVCRYLREDDHAVSLGRPDIQQEIGTELPREERAGVCVHNLFKTLFISFIAPCFVASLLGGDACM